MKSKLDSRSRRLWVRASISCVLCWQKFCFRGVTRLLKIPGTRKLGADSLQHQTPAIPIPLPIRLAVSSRALTLDLTQNEYLSISGRLEPFTQYPNPHLQYANETVFSGNKFQISMSVHSSLCHALYWYSITFASFLF